MKPTTKSLCDSHARTYRKLIAARAAAAPFKLIEPAITITEAVGVPGLGNDCYRVRTRSQINDVCERYIKHCRKARKWSRYHDPIKATMDEHGVTHEAGLHVPGTPVILPALAAPFNRTTLRAYRDRITGHHYVRLEMATADAMARNEQSGAAAAHRALSAASDAEKVAWGRCLERVRRGTAADVMAVCGHQAAMFDQAFRRVSKSGVEYSYEELSAEHGKYAQRIVWEIRKRKGKSK